MGRGHVRRRLLGEVGLAALASTHTAGEVLLLVQERAPRAGRRRVGARRDATEATLVGPRGIGGQEGGMTESFAAPGAGAPRCGRF